MKSTVSVIIPIYNAEKTLHRCVESLVYGNEKSIEIILVDDCSQDKSWEFCQQLQKEFDNVRCVQNKQNSGVSATRNHGLAEAGSNYIMFVDSDDWVSKKFISTLVETVDKYQDCLITCGFHYIDELAYSKVDYCWNDQSDRKLYEIKDEELFDTVDKIMIQNVWNKIFSREIIQSKDIRFDETQSMGEDFQFVLDYMQAANLRKCMVINEALYYYVRANQTSLMSKFGWSSDYQEFQRMEQLAEICGLKLPGVRKRLENQILNLKRNMIYHVVRASKRTKKEKIERIEQIVGDGRSKIYYYQQLLSCQKEKIRKIPFELKRFEGRVKGKIQRKKRAVLIGKEKSILNQKGISVISQNCIGGVFYHDMEMKFLSPTINLFFEEPDFIRFVSKLKYYLELELEMRWEETYPIGRLDDIQIYFMHYTSCKEAKETWNRRKSRINYEKILVLATDRNGFTDEIYKQWKQLPYKKVLFTVNDNYENENVIVYSEYKKEGCVPNLIPDREFYKDNVLINAANSME